MKKQLLLLSLFCFGALVAQAQEANLIRELFNMEKKAVVEDFLDLSDAEAARFWPLYEDYEAARREIANSRIDNLKQYAQQYADLTDAQADALMQSALKNMKASDKLKAKYYKKIRKTLSAKKATSWLQLEEYIQTALRMDLLDNIPFVGEY